MFTVPSDSENKDTAQEGGASLSSMKAVMRNAPQAMVLTDSKASVLAWNSPAQTALPEIRTTPALETFRQAIAEASKSGSAVSVTHKSALELAFWRVADDMVMLQSTIGPDVAERLTSLEAEQKRLEDEAAHLRRLAQSDHLTGLLNAASFAEQCRAKVSAHRKGVLLYIDLDDFKPVNDLYGHTAGDKVLCTVSERLTRILRSEDLVARLGGDEFGIWLTKSTPQSLDGLVKRIRAEVAKPVPWTHTGRDGTQLTQMLQVRASIGVAASDGSASEFTGLLALADAAMYADKRAHKHRGRAPVSLPVSLRSRGLPEEV